MYDADGNLLIRRDPATATLYLDDEQISLDDSTNTVTGTRYYAINGTVVASRTGNRNPVYLIPDRQNTNQLAITSDTQTVTRRQYLPFGQPRGTTLSTWPGGDKGYVGGTPDPTTNLENLGAREYNPATGRFLSADPVLETTDANQTNGYDYAGNDPVTSSDPTGLLACLRLDDPDAPCASTLNTAAGQQRQREVEQDQARRDAYWRAYDDYHRAKDAAGRAAAAKEKYIYAISMAAIIGGSKYARLQESSQQAYLDNAMQERDAFIQYLRDLRESESDDRDRGMGPEDGQGLSWVED